MKTLTSLLVALSLGGCPGQAGDPDECVRLPGCPLLDVCCDAQRICAERVCQGVGYICSVDAQARYAWVDRAAPCDDQDGCTVDDLCVGGRCQGLPMSCDSPPPNVCADAQSLTSFESPGNCANGRCEYQKKNVTCADACSGAKCTGEPCKGVTCTSPSSSCYISPGRCVQGRCEYQKEAEGKTCDPKDSCVSGAKCDAAGNCKGTVKDCSAPNTSGASCVPGTGACQGFACDNGYRDCNSDMSTDGCETAVSANATHCGDCNKPCKAASHSKAKCKGGACKVTCDSGWGDCDGVPANGCERRLGPATCDRSGTNTSNGCGTAYCGTGTGDVTNFGKWYCSFCTHCRKNGNGSYSWCLKGGGTYSGDQCPACCGAGSQKPNCPG